MTASAPMGFAARIVRDDSHRAASTADRNRLIPITPAKDVVTPLGNPWEAPFDARSRRTVGHQWASAIIRLSILVGLFWAGVHIA